MRKVESKFSGETLLKLNVPQRKDINEAIENACQNLGLSRFECEVVYNN